MPRPEQTPEILQRRKRAYDIWTAGILEKGRPASIRSIAMELGVTTGSVNYWRKTDKWDTRQAGAETREALETHRSAKNVTFLLRRSLYTNLKHLNAIISDKDIKVGDRIHAMQAFANICIKLKIAVPDGLSDESKSSPITGFKDDLDEHVRRSAQDAGSSAAPAAASGDDGSDNNLDHDTEPSGDPRALGIAGWSGVSEPHRSGITHLDGESGRVPDSGRSGA